MIRESNDPHHAVSRLRTIVVERRRLVAELLSASLQAQHDIRVVATTGDPCAAADLLSQHRPDVTLIGVTLDPRAAFGLLKLVRSANYGTRVVAIDERYHVAHLREVLHLGAAAYHTQHDSLGMIVNAVRLAAAGETSFCSEASDRVVVTAEGPRLAPAFRYAPLETLTQRELDVFLSVAQGATVKECAEHLNLSASTVDNHKTHVMRKLNIHRAIDLTRLAIREGLISN
jgi:two-component system nitrate/nitrite response regulator NarL